MMRAHIGKAAAAALCAVLFACTAACGSSAESTPAASPSTARQSSEPANAFSAKDILGHKFTYGTIEFEFTDSQIGDMAYGDGQTAPIYAFKVRTDADDVSYDGDPAWRGYTVTTECIDSYADDAWEPCPADTLFLLTGKTVSDETIKEIDFQNAGFEVTKDDSGTLNLRLVSEQAGGKEYSTDESTAMLTKSMPGSFAVANTIQLEAQ